jgi:acetoin utilization protein AcuC
MNSSSPVLIYSSDLERYHYPEACPFKTERCGSARNILHSSGELFFREEAPRMATEKELLTFHTDSYLSILKRVSEGTFLPEDLFAGLGTDDCPVFPDLYTYAVLASGGSIRAAEIILQDNVRYCFNPSGGFHHAYADKAGGFCYINDVVLACLTLKNAGKRIFCLDLDAHHGNGTQSAFYNDPRVFTVSMHESGKTLFPWEGFENELGEGDGYGFNVNISLPAGTDDDLFIGTFKATVLPLIGASKPDVVVLEVGMDILTVDPLTHLSMTNNAIADILPFIRQTGLPVLMLGGGGYNPEATSRGWALAWQALCDAETTNDLTVGMGGMFLGNAEWDGGLRDMRNYTHSDDKAEIEEQLRNTADFIQTTVFPIHGI